MKNTICPIEKLEQTTRMTRAASRMLAKFIINGKYDKIVLFKDADGVEWNVGSSNESFSHIDSYVSEYSYVRYHKATIADLANEIYSSVN